MGLVVGEFLFITVKVTAILKSYQRSSTGGSVASWKCLSQHCAAESALTLILLKTRSEE